MVNAWYLLYFVIKQIYLLYVLYYNKTWFLYNQSILLKGNVCPANILPTDLSAYKFFYLVYEYNSLSFRDCLEGIIWFDATILE